MSRYHSKSNRNYGYGKQLSYAGRNALKTTMAGQHHSIATHSERWQRFCDWAKTQDIKEAHQINNHTLKDYAGYLKARLNGQGKSIAVSTAQNRLSTCNTVLKALRGNNDIFISPAEALDAKRCHIRTEPPELSRVKLAAAQQELYRQGHGRIAALLGLCRELGLRSREAALLDCQKALIQAKENGVIDIERGTKGGRGKSTVTSPSRVERLVPVSDTATKALEAAVAIQNNQQENKDNLVPINQRLPDFLSAVRHNSGAVLKKHGLNNRHDLRAAYACERYQQITHHLAPVIAGKRECVKSVDRKAREAIALVLGHQRTDVVASYLGSAR
ncbi:integrase domain-containing protein [Endozoicomonas gorgoniicola]|uniref:Integrase domain-containing protein n=1 Tax=Endozoicomonas gorgoniicola TaxID=1234144 RepID=A0ABT3MWB7_9GAMM|nr:integrase domain-containing protein [Endozoicomonas gorgoniicola]MCW7553677.1 integrase domain-containing protein [Endozoicomonas gorgoniicola]